MQVFALLISKLRRFAASDASYNSFCLTIAFLHSFIAVLSSGIEKVAVIPPLIETLDCFCPVLTCS